MPNKSINQEQPVHVVYGDCFSNLLETAITAPEQTNKPGYESGSDKHLEFVQDLADVYSKHFGGSAEVLKSDSSFAGFQVSLSNTDVSVRTEGIPEYLSDYLFKSTCLTKSGEKIPLEKTVSDFSPVKAIRELIREIDKRNMFLSDLGIFRTIDLVNISPGKFVSVCGPGRSLQIQIGNVSLHIDQYSDGSGSDTKEGVSFSLYSADGSGDAVFTEHADFADFFEEPN